MTVTFKFVTVRTKFTKATPKGEDYQVEAVQILNLNPAVLTDEKGRKRSRQEINTLALSMQNDLGASSFTLDL